MKMWLTERDMKLLDWINRIGFVNIEQVAKWLNIAVPTAYIRLRKLVSNAYLIQERVFHEFDNTEIWYFCGSEEIRRHLMPVMDVDQFKIDLLSSFIGTKQS